MLDNVVQVSPMMLNTHINWTFLAQSTILTFVDVVVEQTKEIDLTRIMDYCPTRLL